MIYVMNKNQKFLDYADSSVAISKFEMHIINLSLSNSFNEAKSEWKFCGVIFNSSFVNCPCGQAIKEQCIIRNVHNGNTTSVGNVCVNEFMGIKCESVFDGIKRIAKNNSSNANIELINYAKEHGFLFGEKEYSFLMDTCRKKKLSEAQLKWKIKINNRILSRIVVNTKV